MLLSKLICKRLIAFAAVCFFLFLHGLPVNAQQTNVIPKPASLIVKDGFFKVNKSTVIVLPDKSNESGMLAEMVQQALLNNVGKSLKLAKPRVKKNVIRFVTDKDVFPDSPEAYLLLVDGNGVTVKASSCEGLFYGTQTLLQLIRQEGIPFVSIKDEPRFPYRGFHLDVSRNFFPKEFIFKMLDWMAFYKLNTFHWHLTEDQGWRIEIKKYPRLTEIGSKRTETVIGRNSGKYDGKPHGGFYTQAEAREIVAYAAERYINVVPEIDMPGHMLGALASYPELGCTGGPYQVWRQWGVSDDVLCMGNDKTFEFITDVLNEIMDIFPSKYIHIGGDECPKTNWKKCEKCQARITSLGLKADEHHSAEERLQSYFISYAEKVINKKSRRMIGWDEILEGGLAPDATVMSWRGMSGGIAAAKMDHDVIMTPNSHLYFDHYQTKESKTEPLAIGGNSPVEKVYSFNPIPAELNAAQRSRIIGVQANLWTEYVPNFRHAEYMVLPRMAALCEVQWSPSYKKDYENFLKRLPMLVAVYKLHNYNYAKHVVK